MPNSAMFTLLLAAGALAPGAALGQRPVELAMRGGPQPHFVAAWAPEKEREADRSAALAGRVSLELANVSLDEALKILTNEAGLNITYSPAVLPLGKRVTIKAGDIAVITALTEMLFRSGLDVVVDQDGMLALVPCKHTAPTAEIQDSGTIVGTVTDKATGSPLAGATVVVEGTTRSATTSGEGTYRIEGVEPGARTVRARYIGYAVMSSTVTVVAGEEVATDFALVKSTQKLDELVTVTPGGMQTEARALPSPVTVITAEEIASQGAQAISINEVFRQLVPSGVGFNFPASPQSTILSVRGASSISGGSAMKIFIDGVEVADRSVSPVDPSSIERIEIIRGPQAASLYGPDAAGGVLQIYTKRGTTTGRPQVGLRALAGVAQTPYTGRRSVLRQEYHGTLRGGSSSAGYNIGASFSRLGDWVPVDAPTGQSYPSAFAGLHYAEGIVDASLSARYLRTNLPIESNPELVAVGGVAFSRPQFLDQTWVNQTYGARLAIAPARSWRSQVTVGYDESGSDLMQTERRLTTPDDTLFQVSHSQGSKGSFQLNSSIQQQLGPSSSGTLTAGVDYYRAENNLVFASGLLNNSGQLQTTPATFTSLANATVTNTGVFVQGEAGWRDMVFVTAGLRADNNSTFGDALGTQVQPRVGVSIVSQIGQVSTKVRGAWGRAIRAPAFGQSLASAGGFIEQLANPALRPERQSGWDAGLEFYFGSRASLSLTWYDQAAEDLITSAVVATSPVITTQYRNLGRVKNRGFEVEGSVEVHPVRLRAQYAYTHSRIRELGPDGVPGLEIGGQLNQIPVHTAGVTITSDPWPGGSVGFGANYVGSYRGVDIVALLGCFAGNLPCPDPPTFENFIRPFTDFVKLNLSVTQELIPQVDALLTVNNLTNNTAFEGIRAAPVMGRVTQAGLHARF